MPININEAYTILLDHYEPFKEVILKKLDEFDNSTDKIKFLKSEKVKYLFEVLKNPNLMHASGVVNTLYPHEAGLDRWIKLMIMDIENSSSQSKGQKMISYVWQNEPNNELPELYNKMIDKYKLIASETTYEQFKAVFTGQPIDEIVKIERTKKFTNVLLAYFVSRLFQKSNPHNFLSIAEKCFSDAKNLNQAQNNYFNNQNRLPKNYEIIDGLKNPL
jgi:hypothetical protein